MKILMITPYVTINSRSEFSRNKTGFGYMVMDIAKAVAKLEKVDVLTTDTRGDSFKYENVNFCSRTLWGYISNFFACLSINSLFGLKKKYKMRNATFVRLVYYWLMTGYLRELINKGDYDIVHIHGCGFRTELWMQVCQKCHQKYVVTLHGLNSFSDTVRMEPAGRNYEKDFLKRVTEGEIPITVISTGIKKTIERAFNTFNCKNINIVCNSFNFDKEIKDEERSVRELYHIPVDAKVLLYVGNISKNKNQQQMVRVFGILPEKLRRNTYVLFCGEDHAKDSAIDNEISKVSNADHLIFCGGVDKSLMPYYYSEANGVVLLSFAEGFGLSLIEGMYFGLPCMMPRNLDAFEDIYNSNSVIAIEDRGDQSVADALQLLLTKEWNKQNIRAYSMKFNDFNMANSYVESYKSITKK